MAPSHQKPAATTVKVTVLYFAASRDAAGGATRETFSLDAAGASSQPTTDTLLSALVERRSKSCCARACWRSTRSTWRAGRGGR
jgi:hypothetical protein